MIKKQRTEDDFYKESKRLRAEVLAQADALKEHPMHFTITNGITMNVEITKSDLKTIVSKASRDNKFNAIKNALAKDIRSFIEKGEYIGWRTVAEGKHGESAYFAYFDREIGVKIVLAMRKMKNGVPINLMQSLTNILLQRPKNCFKKELRFNGLTCRTNRGYPSEAEFKSASIFISRLPDQPGLLS